MELENERNSSNLAKNNRLKPIDFASSGNIKSSSSSSSSTKSSSGKSNNKRKSNKAHVMEGEGKHNAKIISHTKNGELIDQNIDLELYKTSPTIAFIKQKYKMYLEWLDQNNNKSFSPNSTNNSNKNPNINQLTWYSYEKSLKNRHSNHTNHHTNHSNGDPRVPGKKVTIELSNHSNLSSSKRMNASSLSTMTTSTSGISSTMSSTSSIENVAVNKGVKFSTVQSQVLEDL